MNPIDMAQLARNAMLTQLNLEPKPGLVSPSTSGPHMDMDYDLMCRAIEALTPHLVTLGQTGLFVAQRSDEEVSHIMQQVALSALEEVESVTGGINALRGTVLAVGLFITAYYRAHRLGADANAATLVDHISRLAVHIPRRKDSHGDWVEQSYHIGGALDSAKEGYATILTQELFLYRHLEGEDRELRTLLHIMSWLQDSCVYYRVGADLAQDVRTIAQHLYQHYNREDVRTMCSYFERCHISTGGSGDMLTLLLLADQVLA